MDNNVNMDNMSNIHIVSYSYSDGTHTVKCLNTLAGHLLRLTFIYNEGSTEFSSMVIEKTKECARTLDKMHPLVENGHMFIIKVRL
jgi:hypothetical protein